MAARETPKKLYFKSTTAEVYICKAVVDKNHCKDLFKSSNRTVLNNVEPTAFDMSSMREKAY